MGELNVSTSEPAPADSRKWIGRILIAFIVGEAIWTVLISLTNNLIVPGLAKALGGDNQLSQLGKTDFNFAALLTSVLELCLAAIVSLLIYAWSHKPARTKPLRSAPQSVARPISILAPPTSPPTAASATAPAARAASTDASTKPPSPSLTANSTQVATPAKPSAPLPASPPPQAAKPPDPAQPKKPKAVRYNLVGDPVDDE